MIERSPELREFMLNVYLSLAAGENGWAAFSIQDPLFTALGSDSREVYEGHDMTAALTQAQIETLGGWIVRPTRLEAFADGDFGWAFAMGSLRAGDVFVPDWRETWVFKRVAGEWKAVHCHVSIGVPNEELGAHIPTSLEEVAEFVARERPNLAQAAAPDGTVTILFTDIESSTEWTERLGDDEWMRVLRSHNEAVRNAVAEHGGTEVKAQGDGFMIVFPSARAGVRCASRLQSCVASYDPRIRLRAGLHTGEAIREEDDFFGKSVILASRIAGQAGGGEVLVSSLVRELTESSGEFAFDPPREVELKGLSGAHLVHPVRLNGA